MKDTVSFIDNALDQLRQLLYTYNNSSDISDIKKAKLLSYWLFDYTRMLKLETTFEPQKLKRYRRGEIIKVHLGYNIGSEEGGLHYCIVLDKNNTISNPTVTVIPLTSVKANTNIEHLHRSKVFLGDTIYCSLNQKLSAQASELGKLSKSLRQLSDDLKNDAETLSDEELLNKKPAILQRLETANIEMQRLEKLKLLNQKLQKEISKMKLGSIALVSQITTISKIRIYDPLHGDSTLSGVRLTPIQLDSIDRKVLELYIGKS